MTYYIIELIEHFEDWMGNLYTPELYEGCEKTIEEAWAECEGGLGYYLENHFTHLDRQTEEYFGELENIPLYEENHWRIEFRLTRHTGGPSFGDEDDDEWNEDDAILDVSFFFTIKYDYRSRKVEMEFDEEGCSDLGKEKSDFLRAKCEGFMEKFSAAEIEFFENESEESRSQRFC